MEEANTPERSQEREAPSPRARAVTVGTLVLVCVAVPFVARYASLGLTYLAWAVAATVVGGLANLVVLRRGGDARRAGLVGSLLLLVLLVLSNWVSGGFYAPNFGWLYVLPLVVHLFVGKRAGWVMTCAVLLITFAFWYAPHAGVELVNHIPLDQRPLQGLANRLSAILTIGALAYSFADIQHATEVRLETTNAALETTNAALEAKAEEISMARDGAVESAAARQRLLEDVSHELRTPLNGVVGFLEILMAETLSARQRQHVEHIQTSCAALRQLLDDLLDVSKVDAGHMELDSLPFDPAELLESAAASFAGAAHLQGLELITEVRGDFNSQVHGDGARIKQILANLINNALKFTPSGEVSVILDVLSLEAQSIRLRFEVADTGVGLSPEDCAHVFEPFVQGSAGRQVRGGTGLGLAICDRYLRLMGSRLEVRSELGVGSRFFFDVELEVEAATVTGEHALVTGLQGSVLLVVDSKERFASAIAELVKPWGVACLHAHTIGQAVQRLSGSARKVDFALVDLRVLGSDLAAGLDPLRAIAEKQGTALVAVGRLLPEVSTLRSLGFAAEITRTLRRRLLLTALVSAATRSVPTSVRGPVVSRRSSSSPGRTRKRSSNRFLVVKVLLVEDNEINQKVARGLLQVLGVSCDVADNGRQAVELLSQGHAYRAVLMDCQMPVLDGYEATAEIRAAEAERGVPRVPIIAVTANARQDEHARALSVGMDDILTKPLTLADLQEKLDQWKILDEKVSPGAASPGAASPPAAAPPSPTPDQYFDERTLRSLRRLDRRVPGLLDRTLQQFVSSTIEWERELIAALAVGDLVSGQTAAHALRGDATQMGASRLAKLCLDLEMAPSIDAALELGPQVRSEADRARQSAEALRHRRPGRVSHGSE